MSIDILGTSWDQCWSMVQYSLTSTETIRLASTDSPGRPPRLSHSSWTMVFFGADDDDELMLNVLRCQLTYQGQVVTNAEARFNKSLRPRKPEGSLGRTAQDVHLDSHTAPELWFLELISFPLLYSLVVFPWFPCNELGYLPPARGWSLNRMALKGRRW